MLLAFLLFFLFLLGGKMSIIAMLVLSLGAGIAYVIKTKRWIMGTVFVLLPVGIFLVTMNVFENTKTRFTNLFVPDNYQRGDMYWNNIASRLTILQCTMTVYGKNPVFGT